MLKVWEPQAFLEFLNRRRTEFYPEIEAQVRAILERVRREGDGALYAFTRQFDGADLEATGLRVTEAEYREAEAAVSAAFRAALQVAVENIAAFHRPQVPTSWFTTRPDGTIVGQRVTPVDRAGVYVPGGSAPLFSCLLMTAIPAVVAGVPEVIVCTPPDRNGRIDPHMLVAARAAGVKDVYKVGGAQAIGAMAYGTATVPRVDKIAGPGNYYVTLAKKLVFGPVGIDMLAGPTEVMAVDDGSVDAEWLAADLLSQAEHPNGMVILVTTAGPERIAAVGAAMARHTAALPRAETIRRSVAELGAALAVDTLEEAADLVNAVGPEHLEVGVADPWAFLPLVRHAGSIFLGRWTPEAMGDYIAGPSNVIPTEGTARYASPVCVETFIKRSAVTCYSEAAFRAQAPHAVRLALTEDLLAHAASMQIRLAKPDGESPSEGREAG
ncbi:histidinol dehydrogenase [Symbiobacterium thermophilum]|uniref:Histidinol dehydrogenase n=3 Tax=Symbiobacterium thermophilum TaxID=2734 RepID=HISX_SYMTH|nr:histidinol dehydrogenase [Symbiobacterium thermophilum]Q67KH6.1 RecName: Full=Histidinol dehydrogenase; Short=HDH [Symbiobacterium thermophilum IAM 14863]MBY6274793.1 histidinol dehydrogenase [Symbiobacterium thermophilum]BAD41822.1 histidinol dehydrogenase [Symbiobacterium thermophilum IAM 14863]